MKETKLIAVLINEMLSSFDDLGHCLSARIAARQLYRHYLRRWRGMQRKTKGKKL